MIDIVREVKKKAENLEFKKRELNNDALNHIKYYWSATNWANLVNMSADESATVFTKKIQEALELFAPEKT